MFKAKPLRPQTSRQGVAVAKAGAASFWGHTSRNLVKNLLARDLGLLSSAEFISGYNLTRLGDLKLSRARSFNSLPSSITWLSLDNIDSRL